MNISMEQLITWTPMALGFLGCLLIWVFEKRKQNNIEKQNNIKRSSGERDRARQWRELLSPAKYYDAF